VGERAEALASQFEQANDALINSIESMNDAQWKAICSGEQWSVGVTAHHVAGGHPVIGGMVQMVAAGQPLPPLTWEQLEQSNQQHAKESAHCTKEETLAMLRQNGQTAAETVRSLTDEQLARSGSIIGNAMTAEQIVENIMIAHVREHSASIKQATG